MLKRIIDFLLYPCRKYLKALEESDNWFRDEISKAFSGGDTKRGRMLYQVWKETGGI